MATDLTAERDHPATLLEQYQHPEAAASLRGYEAEHALTFVALDNDALAAVRETYAANADTSWAKDTLSKAAALEALADAVRDLLGLADD